MPMPAERTEDRLSPRPPDELELEDVRYEKASGIARVTIARPHVHNCYRTRTLEELREVFRDAAWDDAVGVLVLTGEGDKAFCTGGDVKEYQEVFTQRPRDYWKYMGLFVEAHDLLRGLGKPTIARLNGIVAGGGNEFNMACDLAIAAEHVTIRQVGTKVGSVAAGGATQWLPLMVGDRRAREMLFTCEPIDARKALAWGLVNEVVPQEGLDAAVDRLARKLLDKFPECARYTKQQANFWKDFSWSMTIGHARDWLALHFASAEPWEGMTAFVEKRPPDYAGFRERAASGGWSESLHGPPAQRCGTCGAVGLPAWFKFCGGCGERLAPEEPS